MGRRGINMKVQFFLNSGANIDSCNESDWLDTVKDLGYDDGEWESMSDDEKYQSAIEYWGSFGYPEIYYKEEE